MTTAFISDQHSRVFDSVLSELQKLGYVGELLQRNYPFGDWFLPDRPQRSVPAAAFGGIPLSYDSACIAVLVPNGRAGGSLVGDFRALGAPFALEVGEQEVNVWGVAHAAQAVQPQFTIPAEGISRAFQTHAEWWKADFILRAKNVTETVRPRQLDFIDLGLIPAIEEQVRERLDDLLNEVLSKTAAVYRRKMGSKADEKLLFRLVFRLFAAKVLHDRNVPKFANFTAFDDPARILRAVGRFYQQHEDVLDQVDAQKMATSLLWSEVNFQNLSVEVLAYIYENSLVSKSSRQRLGTHSTPSSIARYLVGRLPFEDYPQNQRVVVEPCSGHSVLLIAAMHRLRELLPPTMDPVKRHQYLLEMLHGFEIDTFALEVGKLCMMLADFPNANGWKLENRDVFTSRLFTDSLKNARFVVCNPPFEDFEENDRVRYRLTSVRRPAELLGRVLDHLHPEGCLGFVLPRHSLDGTGYEAVRENLARRFREIEVIALPDRVFHVSRTESAIVIAKSPTTAGRAVSVSFGEVTDQGRSKFLRDHVTSRHDVRPKTAEQVAESLVVPPLCEVWDRLRDYPRLKTIVTLHRGIEWKQFDETLCYSPTLRKGFRAGFAKIRGDFVAYQTLAVEYLNVDPDNLLYKAINHPWHKPKVVANAARISRGPWRIAAFGDNANHVCSQSFIALWPTTDGYPIEVITAILNGPVANAFVSSWERGRHNQKRTIGAIPIPSLSLDRRDILTRLVRDYVATAKRNPRGLRDCADMLLEIDALVLSGYRLPAHLERKILQFFDGERRPVPFPFEGYDLARYAATRAVGGGKDAATRLAEMRTRRTELISGLVAGTLTLEEDAELTAIDKSLDRYADTVDPLPFDILERLQAEARRQSVVRGGDE